MINSIAYLSYFLFIIFLTFLKRKVIYILFFLAPITIFIKIPLVYKSISFSELSIILFSLFLYFKKFHIYGLYKLTIKKIFLYVLFCFPIIFSFRENFNFVVELTFSLKILCSIILINEISFTIQKNTNFLIQYKKFVLYFLFTNLLALIAIYYFGSTLEWKLFLQNFNLIPEASLSQQLKWSNLGSFSGFFIIHHELAYMLYFILLSFLYIDFNKTKLNYISNSFLKKIIYFSVTIFVIMTMSKTVFISIIILISLTYFLHIRNKYILLSIPFIIILYYWFISNNIEGLKAIRYLLNFELNNFFNTWSMSERIRYDVNSINLILKHPLLGSGNFGFFIESEFRANSHNFWIMIAQKYGLIYFLLFFISFFSHFIRGWRINNNLIFFISILILSFGLSLISSLRAMLPFIVFLSLINILKNKKIERY